MSNQADSGGSNDPQKALAGALGRVPSGLFIVTMRNGEAETGLLTSWVQQCSFEPPQISLAVRTEREVNAWLTPGARFTVNILGEGEKSLVSHFARGFALDEPAFTGLSIRHPEGYPAVLTDALAYLLCEVAGQCPAGDHNLFIARVNDGHMQGDSRPKIHVRKNGLRC